MEQRFTNPRKWTLTPQGVRATKGFIRGRCKPGYVPVCSCKKEMVNVSPAQQAVRSAFVANVRRGAYRRRAGVRVSGLDDMGDEGPRRRRRLD